MADIRYSCPKCGASGSLPKLPERPLYCSSCALDRAASVELLIEGVALSTAGRHPGRWLRHWASVPGPDGKQVCVACHKVLVEPTTPPSRTFPALAPVYERGAVIKSWATTLSPRQEFDWCTGTQAVAHA
jgi:hypothetical protein